MVRIRLLVRFFNGWDEGLCKFALAPVLEVEVTDHAEHGRADEVDKQILHRIVQANIEVPGKAEVPAVDCDGGNAVNGDGNVAVRGVQHHGRNGVDDRVLLHVHVEKPIHPELKKFPQNADGHRKTERGQRHIHGRERKLDLCVAVQDVDQRKADRRAEKAVRRVEHRVPVGVLDEVALELA